MTKKLISCMALSALLLGACSSEEPIGSGEGGNVHFTASLPAELMTRSVYDDGLTATQLTYAVYDEAGNNLEALNPATPIMMENKTGRVDLNLVTGKTYTVVFWAQSPDASYYKFDPKTGKMTVTPTGNSNDLGRDAFFAYETFTVTGAINKPVELRRPFAQINVGTNDLADFTAAGGEISKSGLKVTAPDVLNLLDGSVGESTADYVFAPAAHIGEGFPVTVAEGETPYAWLTTNSVLVGEAQTTVDVAWTSDNPSNGEVPFTFVPVQRNYRTNIYGALLTDPQGFNVTINPGFAGLDIPYEVVSVRSAAELTAALAEGGAIAVDCELATIDLKNYNADKPLVLMLNEEVATLDLGQFTEEAPLTVVVGKDVPYPYLKLQTGSYKNITIVGDLTSSEAIDQVTFGGRAVNNVAFKNVRFAYSGASTKTTGIYTYASEIDNLTISNCKFEGYPLAAINLSIGQTSTNVGPESKITVENCTFEYDDNVKSNCNGIYILGYHNIVVKNNTVKNVPYHGIFVRPSNTCEISGNTVINAGEDGVKVEGQLGLKSLSITDNTLMSSKNVIRCKSMDTVESVVITGNTIDMTTAAEFVDDEPWGILLLGKGTPVLTVKDNLKVGENEHWFFTDMTPAAGSDFAAPFK